MRLYMQIVYFSIANALLGVFFMLVRLPEMALGFSMNALALHTLGMIARRRWIK